ncbi:MAG: phenylalanine--tRNA ligase subunit alpha, partial [Eubacteriales bacterium]|nr:phenylalanine--tRNA ligase subunit alpha [Eubacteriales bacterium]
MTDQLKRIYADAAEALEKAKDSQEVESLKQKVLGKKGELTQILRGMGALSAEERPKIGQKVNEYRDMLDQAIAQRQGQLEEQAKLRRLEAERVDVTMPAQKPLTGHLHPISQVREELENIFIGMGFEVAEGPEVEWDHYNFELLNLPKNHPARDMQDSFYINDNILLRTHTSPVQARIMTTRKPPIRIVCPGRVYRADEVDATHSPVF